tara:strand:+ start:2378 stop:5014 length:2637 start_codon:yes stop_codon:yes gene_type:complete
MKNKIKKLITILFLSLGFETVALTNEFEFKVTDLEILENGNIYKGKNGGKVTTDTNLEIVADNFYFDKLKNQLNAFGNVVVKDNEKNITIYSNNITYLKNEEEIYSLGDSEAYIGFDIKINADEYFTYNKLSSLLEAKGNAIVNDSKRDLTIKSNEIFYLKNEDKFFTIGKTRAFIQKKYTINTSDLIFFQKKMLLSSAKKTTLNDDLSNLYTLDSFEYQVNKEILKGNNIEISTIGEKVEGDKYFFETGFFDLKKKKFLVKDIEVNFDKAMYGNINNDPRLKGASGSGNEFETFLKKGSFTTCQKNDKCPPWLIQAATVKHDKIKKQIIYKDAWLKIYDVPVVYFPKFFHPDPTVKRQSGFLQPKLEQSELRGSSIYTPYFYIISKDKDLTIKPRFYDDNKIILQNEYRQKTKNSYTIADFSYAYGYQSARLDDTKDTRTHLFTKTLMNLNFDNFLRSDLEIQYQKVSNDTYLKLFELESPLLLTDNSTLETFVSLNLEEEKYNFNLSFEQFETLSGTNNDRFQYVLPSFNFSTTINPEDVNGTFNIYSYGNNTLKQTNVLTTVVTNNVNYISNDHFLDNGIKSNFALYLKNLNSVGKNNNIYKTSPQSEIMSAYKFDISYPLVKNFSSLEPKISLMFSPHEMKNHRNTIRRVDASTAFNITRLGTPDSFEEGASLTLGVDFKKEKLTYNKGNNTQEVEDFFEMKLATVIRDKEEKNISSRSTIGQKSSNIFGQIKYTLSEYISLNYDFAIDNDMRTFEYNSIDTKFTYNNFSSELSYLEEGSVKGGAHIIENRSRYNYDKNNSISFNTRRNRRLNLTEYYDLIYEYKNDCLIAGLAYKKKFYNDSDIKPTKELYFTITIVPLGSFTPENLLNALPN